MKESQGIEPKPAEETDHYSRRGEILSDKYRLLRKLGEGGMGAVYEAQHTFVGRRFAIKFLHRELARSKEIMARFQREARAAGALECENIAATTDFGYTQDGEPYIVMEYLEGEDLRTIIVRERQLPVPRIVDIIIQACRGLSAAHSKDIVHRDMKPDNLFIAKRSDGTDLVKILDFGIAKLRHQTTVGASTQTGTLIGTLHYMPIEQIRGDKDIDHRADIYALGAILYEALTGQIPHPGTKPENVIFHLINDQVDPIESLREATPEGLPEAVYKALAFDPQDRYRSVAEFAETIAPFSGNPFVPFHPHAALPMSSSDAKTQMAPISEVRPAAGTRDSKAPEEVGNTEIQRAIEAAGVTSPGAYWRRIAVFVGVAAMAIGLIAVALTRVFGSSDTDTKSAEEQIKNQDIEPAVSPSRIGLVEEKSDPSGPVNTKAAQTPGAIGERTKLENDDIGTNTRTIQSVDEYPSVRQDVRTGRSEKEPIKALGDDGVRAVREVYKPPKKLSRGDQHRYKKVGSGVSVKPKTAAEPPVVEHQEGRRKVAFDKNNPYE